MAEVHGASPRERESHTSITYRFRVHARIFTVLLGLGVLLVTVNHFTQHISPDTSIYLLHARSFVESGNRYTVSHDSKGPVLVLLYAPFTAIFGAGMPAAAALMLLLHGSFALLLYRYLASKLTPPESLQVTLLTLICLSAPSLWGGNMRTEDVLLPLIMLLLIAAERSENAWRWIAGGCIALGAGMKISTLLPLGMLGIAGVFTAARFSVDRSIRVDPEVWRGLLRLGGGFLSVALPLTVFVFVTDSPTEAIRQIVLWPSSYRCSGDFGASPIHAISVLWHSGVWPLWLAGMVMLFARVRKHPRLTLPAIAFLSAEMLRLSLEGTRWSYLAIPMLPVLIIVIVQGMHRDITGKLFARGWRVPLLSLLMLPILFQQVPEEFAALRYRVFERRRSPYEELARQLRDVYRPGERIFIDSNDFQLLLLLDAPRPWPVLPFHFPFVSIKEQQAFRRYHAAQPPDWIVTRDTLGNLSRGVTRGGIDGSYFIFLGQRGISREGDIASAQTLLPWAGVTGTYRCVVDIGWARAWRRESTAENGRSRNVHGSVPRSYIQHRQLTACSTRRTGFCLLPSAFCLGALVRAAPRCL